MPAGKTKVIAVRVPVKPKRKGGGKKKKVVYSSTGMVKGHGDYTYDKPGPWGKAGSWIGSALGTAYGGAGGGKVGSKLGSYLHYIGKIFGSGDYVTPAADVKHNTLVNSSQIPLFGGSDKNTVHIRHREFLGDVYSSGSTGAFSIADYPINPGKAITFPWLSQVCGSSFQQYRINGMVFEFRSMSADALNSTNTALGTVVMATDYDSKDNVFTTKAQMENTEFGVSCKPSSCMIHAIECARNQTSVSELYLRSFAVPSGADIRLYDMGRFQIATVGCQAANVNLGELWVSYDITLFKSIQQVPAYMSGFANYSLKGVTGSAPFGTSQEITSGGSDTIFLTFESDHKTVSFPYNTPLNTQYIFEWVMGTASTAITLPSVNYINGFIDQATYYAPSGGSIGTHGLITGICSMDTATNPSHLPGIQMGSGTIGTVSGDVYFNVYQICGSPDAP